MTNTTLLGALGIGLLAAGVACGSPPAPATPDTAAITNADKDSDSDGVPDSADKCPDKKEDGLGPQPKDGCPNGATPAATPAAPKP